MSSDSIRAAVIGLGSKGWKGYAEGMIPLELTHVGAIMKTKGMQLAAVADIDSDLTKGRSLSTWIKTNFDPPFPAYTNYQKMLSDVEVDVVSIATPVETHRSIARNVVRGYGVKAVLLEKPVAPTWEEAVDVMKTYNKFKVPCVVNHTRRWHPAWKYARKLIREHGEAYHLVGHCNGEKLDAGVHMADLFNWLGPRPGTKYTYVDLHRLFLGKYQPALRFELQAYCRDGLIEVQDNGTVVSAAVPEDTSRYRDLKEYSWSGPYKDFNYMDSNVEAQLKAFEEIRDLASGARVRSSCSLRQGVDAIREVESWP